MTGPRRAVPQDYIDWGAEVMCTLDSRTDQILRTAEQSLIDRLKRQEFARPFPEHDARLCQAVLHREYMRRFRESRKGKDWGPVEPRTGASARLRVPQSTTTGAVMDTRGEIPSEIHAMIDDAIDPYVRATLHLEVARRLTVSLTPGERATLHVAMAGVWASLAASQGCGGHRTPADGSQALTEAHSDSSARGEEYVSRAPATVPTPAERHLFWGWYYETGGVYLVEWGPHKGQFWAITEEDSDGEPLMREVSQDGIVLNPSARPHTLGYIVRSSQAMMEPQTSRVDAGSNGE
jgi:hypothetical protein